MKTVFLKTILILLISVGYTAVEKNKNSINPIKVIATYDGHDYFGYNFSYEDDDEDLIVITFETISDAILKKYNLDDESLQGEKFEITYDYKTSNSEDEAETPFLISIQQLN